MRVRVFLALVLLPAVALPAPAGILFGRKHRKPNPAQRVPELLTILKTDKDEHKRARAAEELRNFDAAAYPTMVPVLVDVLQNDARPLVRAEAATTLSQLRPVSQDVGLALERARAGDSSMRVRLQARSALLQYYWAGYRSQRGDMPPPNPGTNPGTPTAPTTGPTTSEPPLAPESALPPAATTPAPPAPAPRLVPQPAPQPGQIVPPAGGSELRKLPPGPPAPARVPTTAEPPRAPEGNPAPPPPPAGGGGPQLGPAF